jgi:hypothetical protein
MSIPKIYPSAFVTLPNISKLILRLIRFRRVSKMFLAFLRINSIRNYNPLMIDVMRDIQES